MSSNNTIYAIVLLLFIGIFAFPMTGVPKENGGNFKGEQTFAEFKVCLKASIPCDGGLVPPQSLLSGAYTFDPRTNLLWTLSEPAKGNSAVVVRVSTKSNDPFTIESVGYPWKPLAISLSEEHLLFVYGKMDSNYSIRTIVCGAMGLESQEFKVSNRYEVNFSLERMRRAWGAGVFSVDGTINIPEKGVLRYIDEEWDIGERSKKHPINQEASCGEYTLRTTSIASNGEMNISNDQLQGSLVYEGKEISKIASLYRAYQYPFFDGLVWEVHRQIVGGKVLTFKGLTAEKVQQ